MWTSIVLICDTAYNAPDVQALQKWFYSFVLKFDASLHAEISQENIERVFTVSPFYFAKKDYPAWMRITSIDSRLNQLLIRHLPELCHKTLQLDSGETIKITQVHLPKTEPRFLKHMEQTDRFDPLSWVGCINQTQLISTIMQMPLNYRIRLFFHTATSLRNHSVSTYIKSDLLPLPLQVFETYVRRWENFTSSQPVVPINDFVSEYVRLSRYNLRTCSIGGWHWGRMVGFTGYVDYAFAPTRYLTAELAQDRNYLIRTCYLLSAFSFFIGTGQLTSFGLGQTLPNFA